MVNLARNGRSSKSFRDEGTWAKVLLEKPDYVLIQFGHNDQSGKGAERETDPATSYRANMEHFIKEVRAAGPQYPNGGWPQFYPLRNMGNERGSPEVVGAIEGAAAWFRANQIKGIRVTPVAAPGTPKGFDNTVVADPAAPSLWARFYELGTNRPIFCGRDSVVKYSLAEIEYERRNGYRYYVDRPARLRYPEWLRRREP